MNEIKAFIFDLDGVITDSAEYHFLAWKALSDELNIPFTREFNEELKGISRMDSLEKILVNGQMSGAYSEKEKVQLATRKNAHYCTLIEQITPQDILPGIKELLIDLKEHGYKIGVASVSKNAFTVLSALQLNDMFDHIVDAKKIVNSKPDPEIFLRAAEYLSVSPEDCIGIEDAAAGIESIKSAGMYAVGVGSKDILKNADIVVESTNELTLSMILEKYNRNI
ncbi:beta-phosphoglucomutase [Litchfieldia salsa]|uniref:Beta-phosphoglucomutase n=1 Tax=Litchfieldia salsa TaxID=930152 RepID=A0A1H0RXW6_9BACI|nr:beta-phosphoglucomutase [Litchfieldia salsa]SDP34314.1 beta-phosphoglucomutase [Litchfieldia salsa]